VPRPAGSIHFPRGDAGDPDLLALFAVNRSVSIINCGRGTQEERSSKPTHSIPPYADKHHHDLMSLERRTVEGVRRHLYKNRMVRKLGKSGERRFATLVADYAPGAICNDSGEDAHGWDHVVNFDHEPVPGLPADLQSALPAVFVQTKSTENSAKRKVTVKLSNALAFTRSDNPCFVVLVCVPPEGSARYYAVHWWDTLMSRTLKRTRELHRDGYSEESFHLKDFSFTMANADEHDAGSLLAWMKRTVQMAGRTYTTVKAAMRDTLGFETGELTGFIHLGPLESIEQLVDHQLGLTPSIPMAKFELNQRRFAVDLPFPMPDGEIFFASLQANPAATCDVRVRGPDGDSFVIAGELIVPAIPGLTEDQVKYRIRTPIFDLVWRPAGFAKFTCNFDTATLRPITELEKCARFFGWAGGDEIEIMATVDDNRIFGATAKLDPRSDSLGWQKIKGPLATLARLSATRKAGAPLISIEQAIQAEWLHMMHEALCADDITLRGELVEDVDALTFDHGISFAILTVGGWAFGAVVRLPLISQSQAERRFEVKFGRPLLLETYAFETTDLSHFDRLKADYTRYVTRKGVFGIDNLLANLAGEGPS